MSSGWKYPPDRKGQRWCSGCKDWKPLDCFRSTLVNGKVYTRHDCRSCQRAYGTEWWRRNRQGKPRGWRKTAGRG